MSFSSDQPLTSNQLPISLEIPPDQEGFQEISSLFLKRVANIMNTKQGGLYDTQEVADFQQFFTNTPFQFRPGYRQVYNIGAIAKGTTFTFPANISDLYQFTNMYGTCVTDIPDSRPIPYSSVNAVTENISLRYNSGTTNLEISVGATSPNIVSALIIVEYLKQSP